MSAGTSAPRRQLLGGAREHQPVAVVGVAEALRPEGVAREEQGLVARVPNPEGEIAEQATQVICSPPQVGGEHVLGRTGAGGRTRGAEVGAQLRRVVQPALEEDGAAGGVVDERLCA